MSGGSFDYLQYRFTDIYESIEEVIQNNKRELSPKELRERMPWWDEEHYKKYPEDKMLYNYSDEVIEKFKEAVKALKIAQVYIQRVDWLLAGDDGSDSF